MKINASGKITNRLIYRYVCKKKLEIFKSYFFNSSTISKMLINYPKKSLCNLKTIERSALNKSEEFNFENKNKGELSSSPIRILNIGKNYFRHINPRRKKILMTLLNAYLKTI